VSGEPTPTTPGTSGSGTSATPPVSLTNNPTPSQRIDENGSTVVTNIRIPTKCGIEYMRFQKKWWRTPDPIKNPPDEWGQEYQDGDVRIMTKRKVRFEPYGLTDVIEFHPTKKTPPPCN